MKFLYFLDSFTIILCLNQFLGASRDIFMGSNYFIVVSCIPIYISRFFLIFLEAQRYFYIVYLKTLSSVCGFDFGQKRTTWLKTTFDCCRG